MQYRLPSLTSIDEGSPHGRSRARRQMAREPAEWAGPSLGAASAGYSVRAPGPHPPSQSHRSLGRLPAPRARSRSAMPHREANGRVPLVPTSRTEIGNGRSSDAARADLPSRSDAESMFRGRLCPSLAPRATGGHSLVRSAEVADRAARASAGSSQAHSRGCSRSPPWLRDGRRSANAA